eukprot:9017613-Karenia_brevis.AAC.1
MPREYDIETLRTLPRKYLDACVYMAIGKTPDDSLFDPYDKETNVNEFHIQYKKRGGNSLNAPPADIYGKVSEDTIDTLTRCTGDDGDGAGGGGGGGSGGIGFGVGEDGG